MLFDSLDKIKRNSIISAILLIALGTVILICPEKYVPSMMLLFGYALIVLAIVLLLDFITCKKTLMDYILFVAALVILIVGICVSSYRSNVMFVLSVLFGLFLFFDGFRTMVHSFTYARRSKRKGWWILSILSGLLILAGILILWHPLVDDANSMMKAVGGTILFSAAVSCVRLIWTWPIRNTGADKE